MTIAENIAKYAHSVSYNDIPKTTIHDAKRLIIDTLGCAIGASDSEPAKIAAGMAQYSDSRFTSTILMTRKKVIPSMAAFANGTMSRYFDYMDTYDGKEFSHPSDNIMPMFAVIEAMKGGGKDVILATTIAYEIQCRLADAASLWKHGWDQVTYGLISVSAPASRFMGLNIGKTTEAINISLNSHIVMRQVRAGELSMWKAAAFANSARNAIFSCALAGGGMTGPSPVFEGEMGFWKQVTGKFELNTAKFGNKRNKFKLGQGIIKYYPAETRAQTAIWAAIQARKQFKSIDEIESVEIGTNEAGYKILGKDPEKWNPKTKETADHSLPYMVAVALMDKKIEISSFYERRFRDKKTLEFMKKIKVKENKQFTGLFNKGGTVNAAEITIKLKNGKIIYEKQIYSKGHPKNPMSDQEVEEKFRRLTKKFLTKSKQDAVLDMIWHLERVKNVSDLFWIIS